MSPSPATARRVHFVNYVRPSGQVWCVEVCATSIEEALVLVRKRVPGTAVWAGL